MNIDMEREAVLQLMSQNIADTVLENMKNLQLESDQINHRALTMLGEIQNVVAFLDLNDFEIVECIVKILQENGFYTGSCHDF